MPTLVRPLDTDSEGAVELVAPFSKSIALRALAASAGAGGGTVRMTGTWPDDVVAFVDALEALGATCERLPEECRLSTGLDGDARQAVRVDIGEGAAPARFLLALAATLRRPVTVDGTARLRERPMATLLEALARLGATVTGGPTLPATVCGPIRGGDVRVEGGASSQFLSALLLVAPGIEGGLEPRVEGPQISKPYVDLTREVLAAFGVSVGPDLRVAPDAVWRSSPVEVESDWSGATALLAAAPLLGRPVRVPRLSLESSQPDRRFVDVLRALGMTVEADGDGVLVSGRPECGGTFDCGAFPDAVPALAALAVTVSDDVVVTGAAHLRIKESDRIDALVDLLNLWGCAAVGTDDGLIIGARAGERDPTVPVDVSSRGDHRIAMAAALLGLAHPVAIDDGGCVSKSFPGFFDQWPAAVSVIEG